MRAPLAALASALLLALGACGDEDDTAEEGGHLAVKVGVQPIADVAPLYLGMKKGFFADERLDVEPRVAQQAGQIIPAVVSGEYQFGWFNTTSLVIARSKRLPLRIVSRGTRGGRNSSESPAHILVRKDGPIKSPKDLEGKTISVAQVQGISTLTANAALEKRAVDVSKVDYIEVPFPQAVPALERGRVDAVYVAEPFATLGLRAGHRSISRPLLETAPNYIIAAYFTTDKYIGRHKNVVDRFARAINRSFDYAASHPAEVRQVLRTYTRIPPAVAQRMKLPDFSSYVDTSTLDLTVRLAKKYGYIKKEPNVSELLYKP